MISSLFHNKQNQYFNNSLLLAKPIHQGRAFKIDIGQSNGPFLSKDLMYSNQKSTYLIAAKNILQTHKSMSNLMGFLSKEQECQSNLIRNTSKVDNWISKCEFLSGQLAYMEKQSKKLIIQQQKLKLQFKNTFEKLLEQSQQISASFMPLFKNLLRTIREQSNVQKHIFQEHKREVEELNKFRNVYLDQLIECQRRIIKVQEFLEINQEQIKNDN